MTKAKPKEETTDLVPIKDAPITVKTLTGLIDTPSIPNRYETVGDMIATILIGREAGLGEMTSLNNLYVVNGTVAMSSKIMSGLIFSAGHFMKMETSLKGATVVAYRRDSYTNKLVEVATFTFGPDDAKRAGLDEKDTYENYPQHMYLNRALSMAGRMVYSDVLAGIGYVPEEVAIEVDSSIPAQAVLVDNTEVDDSEIVEIGELMDELDGEEVT